MNELVPGLACLVWSNAVKYFKTNGEGPTLTPNPFRFDPRDLRAAALGENKAVFLINGVILQVVEHTSGGLFRELRRVCIDDPLGPLDDFFVRAGRILVYKSSSKTHDHKILVYDSGLRLVRRIEFSFDTQYCGGGGFWCGITHKLIDTFYDERLELLGRPAGSLFVPARPAKGLSAVRFSWWKDGALHISDGYTVLERWYTAPSLHDVILDLNHCTAEGPRGLILREYGGSETTVFMRSGRGAFFNKGLSVLYSPNKLFSGKFPIQAAHPRRLAAQELEAARAAVAALEPAGEEDESLACFVLRIAVAEEAQVIEHRAVDEWISVKTVEPINEWGGAPAMFGLEVVRVPDPLN